MTENQTEPTVTEPTEPTAEPQQQEVKPAADPRLAAARKESIRYRERAKAAEGHAADLEKANAELQEKLLGYERSKAITESCAKYEGLTAKDFDDFCTETEPDKMREWADRFAARFGGRLTPHEKFSDRVNSKQNGGGVYAGSVPNMRNAVAAAIKKNL